MVSYDMAYPTFPYPHFRGTNGHPLSRAQAVEARVAIDSNTDQRIILLQLHLELTIERDSHVHTEAPGFRPGSRASSADTKRGQTWGQSGVKPGFNLHHPTMSAARRTRRTARA